MKKEAEKMYKATLFRQYGNQKEYKEIKVYDIKDIQQYCVNGWKCINYTKSYFN